MHTPKELEAWAQQQPPIISQVMALRIALRVFPFIWSSRNPKLTLAAARALYIAIINVVYYGQSFKGAAYQAETFIGLPEFHGLRALHVADAASSAVATIYSGNEAGYLAATATYAERVFEHSYQAYNYDADWVERHLLENDPLTVAQLLTDNPLWYDRTPETVAKSWQEMKSELLALGADWDIWTDLYENRLSGMPYAFSLYPVRATRVVSDIANENEIFWERPPAEVNADIKARLSAAKSLPPERSDVLIIPDQKRAPLETFIRDGRIARRTPEPPNPVEDAREARRRSGREALVESLDDFQEAFPNHNHRGLTQSLTRLRNALGRGIEDLDLIRAAIAAERIQQFALRADDVCSSEMSAEIVSLNITLQQELAHFDEVREYRNELMGDEPVSSELQAAELQVAQALISHEALEDEVSDVLQEVTDYAQEDVAAGNNDSLIYYSFKRSLENTLATAAKNVVAKHKTLIKDGYIDGVKESAKILTVALFAGLPLSALTIVAANLPWLAPVLRLLGIIT